MPTLDFTTTHFRPALGMGGPHVQTLGARFLRSEDGVTLQRERLELPDGDFVDLDHADGAAAAGDLRPLVIVLHGLEGSARSRYALEAYRQLHHRGVGAVGLNFRSCSGELNRAARLYHSGETGDLAEVLAVLRDRFPRRPMAAIGFSLGGNVLLKYLGESRDSARRYLSAATAISVPFDLGAGADFLMRPSGWIYTRYLVGKLQRKFRAKRHLMPPAVDVDRVLAATTFREFDDAATAPLHGFAGADDYYRRSSSAGYLPGVCVPTLLLHSADDPFLPSDRIPRAAARDNPWITACFPERGGHVGFVAGAFHRPIFWAEREAARFVATQLAGSG